MCFTVNVNIVKEEMERRFDTTLNDPDSYRPSYYYHAFELPKMPVISNQSRDMIQLFTWGLIPSWTQNKENADKIRFQTFNARSESITEKPSFRKPIQNKRCLVIARGYYEWQHRKDLKVPHFIYLKEQDIISFAGIYDDWVDSITGELIHSFSIITTEANPTMAKIHNSKKRMPVILRTEDESKWLDPELPIEQSLGLLRPFPEDKMDFHTISPLISKRGIEKNTPELIKPFSYDSPGLFD